MAGALLLRAQITFNEWLNYVKKNETVVSTAYLFYCVAASQGRNCSNGWWITSAIDALISKGAPKWKFFPYTPGNQSCKVQTPWEGWKAASRQTFNSTAAMKQYIAANGFLVAQFSVYSDFYNYKKGVYKKSSGATYKGEHAVCVVGYSDDISAWHCVNSWGWDWGEYGFFWIGYGQCGIDASMYSIDGVSTAKS